MNKQEAIETLRDVAKRACYRTGRRSVHINEIVELVNQIDETQKVVVPKFVAEFYESIKNNFEYNVYDLCLQFNRYNGESSSEVCGWFDSGKTEPIQTLVKMQLFGYEVEKEKLYTVEIPDPHGMYKIRYLFKNGMGNIRIGGDDYRDIFLNEDTHLTESEIKQDFDFLWQFAKEVE